MRTLECSSRKDGPLSSADCEWNEIQAFDKYSGRGLCVIEYDLLGSGDTKGLKVASRLGITEERRLRRISFLVGWVNCRRAVLSAEKRATVEIKYILDS